jgi:hypothetical protein
MCLIAVVKIARDQQLKVADVRADNYIRFGASPGPRMAEWEVEG